ncbi:MAG TPA: hypothetical protein VLJ17_14095 [Xanthobacteraceae bacterium]|nr:hypothetical protein [Xanthobacteraceae bacterium]
MKTLVAAVAVALCAGIAVASGRAQEDAPKAGSDSNAPRADAVGIGAGAAKPGDGFAGLQRRASRQALVANMPNSNTGIGSAFTRQGADPTVSRNAIGGAVAGGPGHNLAVFIAHPGISTNGATGVAATGNAGGAGLQHPPVRFNAGPAPQRAGLNGAMMGRIGSGLGHLGGAISDRSGIDGTRMRSKH